MSPENANKIIIRTDSDRTKVQPKSKFKEYLTIYTPLLTILSLTIHNLYFYEDLHISEIRFLSAFFYFSKKNIMNLLFIKKGLVWILPLIAINRLSSNYRTPGIITRLSTVLGIWYVTTIATIPFTKVPSITDILFYYSGGSCQYDLFDNEIIPKRQIKVKSLDHCRKLKGQWVNGHDLSGHLFFLSLMCWVVGMEVFELNGKSYNKSMKFGKIVKITTNIIAGVLLGLYGYNIMITVLNEFHQYSEVITGFLWGYLSGYFVYSEYL